MTSKSNKKKIRIDAESVRISEFSSNVFHFFWQILWFYTPWKNEMSVTTNFIIVIYLTRNINHHSHLFLLSRHHWSLEKIYLSFLIRALYEDIRRDSKIIKSWFRIRRFEWLKNMLHVLITSGIQMEGDEHYEIDA